MSVLKSLKWDEVRRHYDDRVRVHKELLALRAAKDTGRLAKLLLGVSDAAGNYSAEEHGIGPRVLGDNLNAEQRIFDLADTFVGLKKARTVPELIRQAGLKYLGISVGSEASCMLNPQVCWVANTRTVWAHLLVKHDDNVERADEELRLYRDGDETSEMAYAKWADIHATLETALTRLGENGQKTSRLASVEPGTITFLWADAIAAYLYAQHKKYPGVLKRLSR
jgi:hypothetical protein